MGRKSELLTRSSPGRTQVSWSGARAPSALARHECAIRLFSQPLHAQPAPAADGHHH